MTVSSETNKVTYAGDGVVTAFSTVFTFAANAEVTVSLVSSAGVVDEWTLGTEYTLTGAGTGSAGTVTVDTSPTDYTPATGETLVIQLKPSFLQSTDLPRGGTVSPADTLEPMIDNVVRQNLRQKDELDRAFKVPISESSIPDLPTAANRASKFLAFDSNGDPIASTGPTGDSSIPVSTFMETVLDDTTAAAARTTLGAQAAATARTQGKETVFVPAVAISPTVSNGCAPLTLVETTAGRPDMVVLDFDASADEHAQFSFAFPKSWNEGTVTFRVYWTSTATDTDGVTFGLQGVAVSDGDTLDVAYGAAVLVDDANQSTAEDLYVTAESGPVTIAGTPAEADEVYFRIFRDVSDANDTASEDARLLGVALFFTTNAGNDS